jgi:hypothetical protein
MLWEQARLTAMSDPAVDTQIHAHADRLRALENEAASQRRVAVHDGFDGIREYSRAWHENRSTAYLLGKSWADPVNRWFIVAVVVGIGVIWTYLLAQ